MPAEKSGDGAERKSAGSFLRFFPEKQKKLKQTILISVGILVASLLIYFFFGGEYGIISYWQHKRFRDYLEVQLKNEQRANDSLKNVLDRLENDTLYIERIAREHFGMVRRDERTIKLTSPADSIGKNR